ncbi:MAG: tetratricopeptide repeat protein, partial [Bacillota bacterium]|nr:tetratricopeptide repeat protein [Bacillota bacterium]
MYCKNCGQKLNEGAQFCTICGHKVNPVNQVEVSRGPEDNPKITVRRKSSKAIPIIACLLVVILIVGTGIATGWAAPLRAKYNVSLGDKYIKEGNTEKAIVAMEKANSIDRKNIDSRLKLAELYIDAKQEDKAKALLKEALALDNTNQSTYVMLAG